MERRFIETHYNQIFTTAIPSAIHTDPVNKMSTLKSLLKQNGGVSLSEILQKNNITLSELLMGSQKAISALSDHEEGVTKEGVTITTHPTTERRIFVPSHPILYTSISFKPEFSYDESNQVTKQPVLEAETFIKPSKEHLPITNARLSKLTNKPMAPSSYVTVPPNAIKIDITDVFGFKTEANEETTTLLIQTTTITNENDDVTPEKLKPSTARDEILQILNDPKQHEQFSRILKDRNMTIEELIEQRERGSTQTHLADIFHNENKEPEPKDEPDIGQAISFRRQKSLVTSTAEPASSLVITSFPSFKIQSQTETIEEVKEKLYPSILQYNNEPDIILESNLLENDENANGKSEKLYVEDQMFINIPSGVKSAIVASFAIIGLSILVFLVILFAFRWTQRSKRPAIKYLKTIGPKKSAPFFEGPSNSIKKIVNETLRRKKSYKSDSRKLANNVWNNHLKDPY